MHNPRHMGTEGTPGFRLWAGNRIFDTSSQRVIARVPTVVRALTESHEWTPRNCFLALVMMSMLLCWHGSGVAESQDHVDLSGKWKGTRATSGQPGSANFKVQSISFDLSQNGQTIVGSYRCYGGKKANIDCPSPVGKITDGTVNNGSIEIEVQTMPNSVTCTFSGKVLGTMISGKYACHAGGSLSSNGDWKVKRY